MSAVLDGTGALIQSTVSLPGGVQVGISVASGSQVWSYPNLHGDVILTAEAVGTRKGKFAVDPFGHPIDPATVRSARLRRMTVFRTNYPATPITGLWASSETV